MKSADFMAKSHGIHLGSVGDALAVIGTGLRGCIFTSSDWICDFFDLQNGLAGEVFQKFVNYHVKACFVLPSDHSYGERVVELIREHRDHPFIRFFDNVEEAQTWLSN